MISFFSQPFSFRPWAAWNYALSDALASFSYFLLFLLLVRFIIVRKNLGQKRIFGFFGGFLFLAGALHFCNLWAPWYPIYGLQSLIKLTTAISAFITMVFVWRLLPKAIRLPGYQHFQALEERLNSEKKGQAKLQREKEMLEEVIRNKEKKIAQAKRDYENQKAESEMLAANLHHAEEEIKLLHSVLPAINETTDFYTTLETAVKKICETFGCPYGEVWVPRADGKVMECVSAYHESENLKEFFEFSRELKFPPNVSMVGKAWASNEMLWIEDIFEPTVSETVRREKAMEAGLRSVLAVPVVVGDKITAVLVFFMVEFPARTAGWLKGWIATLGAHLSMVFQRNDLLEQLERIQEMAEKRIQEQTAELEKSNQELIREVAESKKSEESIRKSQENFQTLVNTIEGIVWEYDLRTNQFTFVSDQTEKILGYPVEAWLSDPAFWQDHIHGGDREQVLHFREDVAQTQKGGFHEYRMITVDGQTLWMRDMLTVVNVDGEVKKLRGVMVNITEGKQAQEALNQERNFVSAVLDTASAMVVILDSEGRITRFNRACEQISGYQMTEVTQKPFWDLFSLPEESEKIKKNFARLLAGQFPTNYESSWIAKDGTQRAIAWSSTALLNKYGHIVHVVATGIDITKRKEIEQKLKEAVGDLARSNSELDHFAQELKEANKRLRKLDELKSNFISAASHELKTPLTSLKGYVEMVLNEEAGSITDEQKEYLGFVKESADRLYRLLRELLDISKIESGQAKMSRDFTDVRDLIREETVLFKVQAAEKGVTLNAEVDPALRSIYCDSDKIREVLDNLLSNAIKYTPPRGKIIISARNHNQGIQIAVQDTGIGIRKMDQTRIFEPFQHIEKDAQSEKEESTGLGLTLVKKIVEAHGGNILLQSEEGRGSIFTVILPLDMKSKKLNELIGSVS